MRYLWTNCACFGLALLFFPTTSSAQAPVELELITEPGFPLTGSRRWLRTLEDIGVTGLRIRAAKSGETGGIKNVGNESQPRYVVKGILSAKNQLRVPGGTFSVNDVAGIKRWVAKLKADGVEGLFARTGAFGLTGKQLLDLHKRLSRPVTKSTKDEKATDVASKIIAGIDIRVVIDPATRATFEGDEKVSTELLGMSSGTALAAILRPLGLVVVPQRPDGGATFLVITDATKSREIWPVGWPPEKSTGETMPKLLDFLNVEIDDFALSDALNSIQERLEAPFLYDENNFARHGIDASQVNVSLPKMRTYYKKVIDRLLLQVKPRLTSEVRVDEAGKPFLWITTMKQ